MKNTEPITAALPVRHGAPLPWSFELILHAGEDGPDVGHVRLGPRDFADPLAEVWRDAYLRRGFPNVPFAMTELALAPTFAEEGAMNGGAVTGFVVTACDPRGRLVRRPFALRAFTDIALDEGRRLVAKGELAADAVLHFTARAEENATLGDEETAEQAAVITAPIAYVRRPLGELRRGARTVGELAADDPPVFFTEEGLTHAESIARRGARSQPPLETGGVLIGFLGSCPESGELYAVITDCLEATDAESGEYSLAFTGLTWTRLQTVLRARRRQPASAALLMLGQAHGHPFPPAGGAPPCEACATAKVCGRTNTALSLEDRTWNRAVFPRQPWAVAQIFGLNARGEHVQAFFGLRGNRLLERGFQVIPDFSPGEPSALAGNSLTDTPEGEEA